MIRSRFLVAGIAAVTAAALYACADRVTGTDTTPASIEIVSGQGQSGKVAEELAQPIVVRVRNAGGHPLGGLLVNFRVVQGGGSVFAGSALSNGDGLAQERWTLGKSVADSQIVEARVVDASTGAAIVSGRFLATAVPGTPITLQKFNNPQSTLAGTQLPDSLLVLVSDAYGNAISGATVKWTVESGGGSVNNASALTTATGYASTKWTLGPNTGTQTLLAAVGTTLSTEFSATALAAGSVQMTKVAGDRQTAAPGAAVSVLPSVQLIDPNNGNPHPLGGVAVTFAVTRGGGTITGANAVTNASGIATVGSWVLGSQSGPNELTASISAGTSVTFTATGVQTSPDISVSFVDPVGPYVGDTAPILVRVDSRFPLSTVRAALDGKVVNLTSPRQYYWSGSISLVGAPRDTMTIVVTATDANGSVGQGVRALIHDRAPRVIVTQPADTSVARPNTLIDASCEDDDPNGCTITVNVTDPGTLLAGPTLSPMHTSISLAAWEGLGKTIAITAHDSRDQATTVTRFLWVESSPHLQSIGTAPGPVFDADDSRLLWSTGSNVGITVGIAHLGGSSETIASGLLAQGSVSSPYLTPTGAVFAFLSSPPGQGNQQQLYVWRSGSLTTKTLNSTTVAAAGNFIAYTNGPLYRQDVSTGAEVLVSNAGGITQNSVAENGDVAYNTSSAYDVVRFRGGTTTNITTDNGTNWWNQGPITDGTNIVFLRRQAGAVYGDEIWIFDGTALSMLAPSRTGSSLAIPYDYQVNGGWTAFTKADASGYAQVWTRSPSGVLRAVSAFNGSSSIIRALGSDGSVVFDTETDRYFASATGSPTRVSAANGTVVWRSGHFIMLLGNEAFTVSP